MRTIPATVLPYLQTQYGSEPIFIVEVAWSRDTSNRIAYSDQKIEDAAYPYPTLVELENFDTSLRIQGASDSQSTTVTLDDTDGSLRSILDIQDIQKCPCWIYQTFKGLPYTERILLFSGEISSPINWDEGSRTLQFTIATKTTETDVAFSMEEGDFPNVPEDALGKVWPLIFGTVCHMQAVQVRSPRKGYLARGEGIHDFTIEQRICQAHYLQCRSVVINSQELDNPEFTRYHPWQCADHTDCTYIPGVGIDCYTVTCDRTEVPGDVYGPHIESEEPEHMTEEVWGPDPDCVEERFNTICELEDLLRDQKAYEHQLITINGGSKFPQGQRVTIDIDGAKFIGVFSGDSFAVLDRLHPDYDTIDLIQCHAVETVYSGQYELVHWNSTWIPTVDLQTWYVPQTYHSAEVCSEAPVWVSVTKDGVESSQQEFEDMPTSTFCWLPAGSEVFLEEESEVLYIVSLIPGTINNVAAYKKQKTTGRELLMTVPTNLYTVYETDYTGYIVTEIGFEKPLSKIDDSWSDDIYVSFTSDVGPNPVDIIAWLITQYTDLTFDATSKAYVRAKLVNYPTNFWVKEKLNVLQLIQDIAYQCRCAIYTREDTLYIVYLSEEPSSVRTFTESNILANTFKLKLSDTNELTTKYSVDWSSTEAGIISTDNVQNKLILKYNANKYGISEVSVPYYTQNTYETILKSATFWLIRGANTWKQVEFDSPLSMLDLDLFDCVTIDVDQFSTTPVKAIITGIQYNNKDNTIHFECTTSIRSGETTPYPFFWPANISATSIFPPPSDDSIAGAGYPFIVTPPVGHILRGGNTVLDDQTHIILSAGDQYPSDTGDVLPTTACRISDQVDIIEPDPVIKALTLAKKAKVAASGSSKTPPVTAVGQPIQYYQCSDCGVDCGAFTNICTWKVTVMSIIPILTRECSGGPCSGGPITCSGIVRSCCYTFSNKDDAEIFRNGQLGSIAEGLVDCGGVMTPSNSGISGVSQPEVKYGSAMNQTEPWGGWVDGKEEDLCGSQISNGGFGPGGSVGSKCTCTDAYLGGRVNYPC
ncbi:hypothetical protein M0R72_15415 [Candidatus Pacearchaeota archaeon]|jgi:hypothetical protein|nr:hypothetical protein [Candidatus Pacearchaeota archaeon]